MTTLQLRSEILKQIEKETDGSLLEAIWGILRLPNEQRRWRAELTRRALEAEEEIKAGMGRSVDEVFKDLDDPNDR